MKIILVIKDAGKTILYITEKLEYLSLDEAVAAIKSGLIKNSHLVSIGGKLIHVLTETWLRVIISRAKQYI